MLCRNSHIDLRKCGYGLELVIFGVYARRQPLPNVIYMNLLTNRNVSIGPNFLQCLIQERLRFCRFPIWPCSFSEFHLVVTHWNQDIASDVDGFNSINGSGVEEADLIRVYSF